jgi:starvation-inducible DNA-binding protein
VKPNIGLSDKSRDAVVKILNVLLADEYVLYTRSRSFHWNVVAPNFSELHAFFQAQYEELDGIVDEVAERARTLGGAAAGSLGEFLKLTRLKESPALPRDAAGMVAALLEDHESVIQALRRDLALVAERHGDVGTNDFLTGLMERHEKMAWMLRAHLAAK